MIHGRRGRLIVVLIMLAAALVAVAATYYYFTSSECLIAECNGAILFAWPIDTGEIFEVTFIHSLNKSPITDVIMWTGVDLSVVKSIFLSFGAGVPIPSDGIGTELVFVDGHYELIGIDKHMSGFYIMTQDIPDHRIVCRGREASLLELAGSGASVYITVKRLPPWRYINLGD